MRSAPRCRLLALSVTALLLSTASNAALAQEKRVTLKDQTAVSVTIYNANLAMIRDHRRIKLNAGTNLLAFVGVSGRMRPETALLTGGKGVTFKLLEQNFNYDLLTPRKLLEKSVGKEITVIRVNPKTKEEERLRATVLSTNGGTVLKIGNEIYTGHVGRFVFDKIPENLRAKPTLVMTLDSKTAVSAPVELTYLSRGLSWKADYVALLNDAETKMDLNAWITLKNNSGTSFRNARLQLVAGDVNVVRGRLRSSGSKRYAPSKAREDRSVRRQALADYHLYTLERLTTIAHKQQKQVALLKADGVGVIKQYRFDGGGYYYRSRYSRPLKQKATVWLNFRNDKKSNAGLPLPKGIVRVYKKDASGKAVFIGEDRIGHTAENEDVKLRVGRAFDISAVRVQTDYKREGFTSYTYETAYKVTLRNAKPKPVEVIVSEVIPGDWRPISQSHPHKKVSANRAEWKIKVPAKGSTVLTYRVRISF